MQRNFKHKQSMRTDCDKCGEIRGKVFADKEMMVGRGCCGVNVVEDAGERQRETNNTSVADPPSPSKQRPW